MILSPAVMILAPAVMIFAPAVCGMASAFRNLAHWGRIVFALAEKQVPLLPQLKTSTQ